ncbi:MAG: glycosyltransferase family 4 protein [Aggregatilineales bacterium]
MFNPSVILAQLKHPPTWLWLGGTWYLPTNVMLTLLMSGRQCPWLLGHNESTIADRHSLKRSAAVSIRHALLRPYDGWIVPGAYAAEYVHNGFVGKDCPVIRFPNTVDSGQYGDRVAALRSHRGELRRQRDLDPEQRVLLWPARLIADKGIVPFLERVLPLLNQDHFSILIAGDGPLRPEIEAWLSAHDIHSVLLLGHRNLDQLLELYALSDALLLPSLSEPYGFVAVEALWARLPLFLSTRVGAVPEVLEPGRNGWLIDPTQPEQVCRAFGELLDCSSDVLAGMGEHSFRMANERFSGKGNASRFVDDLLTTFPGRT